ncbi:hypothetical protein BDD43_2499 [Mucilaginibacter gracilis]|uniref:LTXXQ motif family protein n=1 Tax=Mucilaginibacter gracilis TaxID=423350 RepID=A0A495J0N7_9SPHI|nr:hypothetical protein [Mucilaginibacter gracilis]RKR82323.1 hypothetical protein BDD43_2499 [Mucilaginibacter gracilis]
MRYLTVIFSFFVSLAVYGQAGDTPPREDHRLQQQRREVPKENRADKPNRGNNVPNALNRVKLIKTAYITKKLDLTPEQSSKFWPLYNEYQEEMFAVQKQIRLNNSPSQTNGKDQVLNELLLEDKKTNIKRRYANEFMKILPPEKVSLIYKSEKDFQDEILKQFRERKNEAGN